MAFTYTTLTAALQAWAENDDVDFTGNLDTIIGLAELRIQKEADLTITRKEDTSSTSVAITASDTTGLPTDIVTIRWVQVSGESPLIPKDEAFIREFNTNSDTGTLKYYSWDEGGTQLKVAPVASATTTLEIGYTYRITGLSGSNATNWLGDNAPDVLLYACMVEAQAFMKENTQEAQRWKELYAQALVTLKNEEETRRRTDEYRTGEKR